MIGKIIKIVSNNYTIKDEKAEYEATPRGKLKQGDIKPVVRRQCRI